MSSPARSSRLKFEQYRRDFKAHKTEGTSRTAAGHARRRKSQRTFFQLLGAFFGLLGQHRKIVIVAMGFATIATLLGLIPPYGTKLVVDNVLGGIPLPSILADGIGLPQDRGQLLTTVAVGIISFSLLAMILGITAIGFGPPLAIAPRWRRPLLFSALLFLVCFGWAMPYLSLLGPERG